jgi:hypothetical protein
MKDIISSKNTATTSEIIEDEPVVEPAMYAVMPLADDADPDDIPSGDGSDIIGNDDVNEDGTDEEEEPAGWAFWLAAGRTGIFSDDGKWILGKN